MLYVSVWTGLRVSELIGLKWRCIHADSITVEERFSRGDWSVPKTQAQAATIGVSPEVISPHSSPEDSDRGGSGGACDAKTQTGQIGGSGRFGLLLGSGDVNGILTAVQSTTKGEIITSARSYLEAGEVPRTLSTPKHYAYLKIAEGCRKRCAYCIIPTIKGPLKSKNQEQILKEFHLLLNQGVQEIILIAQDLGDYGKDKGSKNLGALLDLLKSMLSVEKAFWLRLLYLYPDEITDELIALMKSDKRICPYLDMPIQHINNEILKAMRRTTSKEDIIRTITHLRKEIPDVVIRTSLIVGFPGETEEQFEELVEFLQKHPLDNVGIFKFSREPGSHAYSLPDQIPEEIKGQRYHRLMQVQKKMVKKQLKKMIGKKSPSLC